MSVSAARGVTGNDPDQRRYSIERRQFTCWDPGCKEVHDGVHDIDGERHVSFRCRKHLVVQLKAKARRHKQYVEEVAAYADASGDERAHRYLAFLKERDGDPTKDPQADSRWVEWAKAWPDFRRWRDENRERLDSLAELRHGDSQPTTPDELEELF